MTFTTHCDAKGRLTAIEAARDIPFAIKRIYYITDVAPEAVRGNHAHRELQQVLICLKGQVKIMVEDIMSSKKEAIELKEGNKGLFVDALCWLEMYDFQQDTVLLVLADEYYNEADYIRDYAQYLEVVNVQKAAKGGGE